MIKFFSSEKNQACLVVLLLLVVTFAVFSSCPTFKLLNWDDDVHLTNNKAIRALSPPYIEKIFTQLVNKTYHPLTTLSFAFEYYFAEARPFLYHLDNVLLHLGVAFLVFIFMRQVGLAVWAAGFAALLFSVHPLRVESVAWVTERKDVLYGIFYMAGLCAYLRYLKDGNKKFYFLMILLAFLSVLSKAMALSFPLILLLLDWYKGRKFDKKVILEKIPVFLIVAGVAAITYFNYVRFPVKNYSEAFLVWPWTFVFYIKKFFYPGALLPVYRIPDRITLLNPEFLSSILAVIGIVLLLVRFRHLRWVLFSFGFYFLSIFFLLRFDYGFDSQCVADRFMYLPSLGFSLLAGFLAQSIFAKAGREKPWIKEVLVFLIIGLLAAAGLKSYRQCEVWRDDASLWRHQLTYRIDTPIALNNFALVFSVGPLEEFYKMDIEDLKEKIKADPFYIRTLERRAYIKDIKELDSISSLAEKRFVLFQKAVKSKTFLVEPVTNIAELYSEIGIFDKSLHYFSLAMRKRPEYIKTRYGLANLCAKVGLDKKAVREFWDILRLKEMSIADCARVIKSYDVIIKDRTKKKEDAAIFVKAREVLNRYLCGLALSENLTDIEYRALVLACSEVKDFDAAILAFQKNLKRNLKDARTLLAFGNVYFDQEKYGEAIKFYKLVVAAQPFHTKAYFNLGMTYAKLQDYESAIVNYRKVIKLDPEDFMGYFNLGFVCENLNRNNEAIFFYEKTLWLKPGYYSVYYNLGNVWAKLNDFKRAEQAYRAALEIEPRHIESLKNLSTILSWQGRKDEAKEYLEKAKLTEK